MSSRNIDRGENVAGPAGAPSLEVGGLFSGMTERATPCRKEPYFAIEFGRGQIYQFALAIMREGGGNNTNGRGADSRKTVEYERDTALAGGIGEWESPSAAERYLHMKEGAIKHVRISPFEFYEISTEVNRQKKQGEVGNQDRGAGETESYSALNIAAKAIGGIDGEMAKDRVSQSMQIDEERYMD